MDRMNIYIAEHAYWLSKPSKPSAKPLILQGGVRRRKLGAVGFRSHGRTIVGSFYYFILLDYVFYLLFRLKTLNRKIKENKIKRDQDHTVATYDVLVISLLERAVRGKLDRVRHTKYIQSYHLLYLFLYLHTYIQLYDQVTYRVLYTPNTVLIPIGFYIRRVTQADLLAGWRGWRGWGDPFPLTKKINLI